MKIVNAFLTALMLTAPQSFAGNNSGGGGGPTQRDLADREKIKDVIEKTHQSAPLIFNFLTRFDFTSEEFKQLEQTVEQKKDSFWKTVRRLRFADANNLCLDGQGNPSMASLEIVSATDYQYCYDLDKILGMNFSLTEIEIKIMSLHIHETIHAVPVGHTQWVENQLRRLQSDIEVRAEMMNYQLSGNIQPIYIDFSIFDNLLRKKKITTAGFCLSLNRVVNMAENIPTYEFQESRGNSYISKSEESFVDLFVWNASYILSQNCEGAETTEIEKAFLPRKSVPLYEVLQKLNGIDFCEKYYSAAVCAKAKSSQVKIGKDPQFIQNTRVLMNELEQFLKKIYAPDRYQFE